MHASEGIPVGLIPAHAGKTDRIQIIAIWITGSSPLTRGKPARNEPKERSRWDHPRSRGENMPHLIAAASAAGSSPLTRGKPGLNKDCAQPLRLIPAHAGKTERARAVGLATRAHPRSRGENSRAMASAASPLGLIPAHAGKTRSPTRRPWPSWAHPRSRGENEAGDEKGSTFEGSSPLTRGKPVPARGGDLAPGLIPAHAGKTLSRMLSLRCRRDHPRSRGENMRG